MLQWQHLNSRQVTFRLYLFHDARVGCECIVSSWLRTVCTFCLLLPVFSRPDQYGPFHIPENAPVGTTVTAVLAGDADVRGGDSWQVNYHLESGNEEEAFTLVTDKQTNEVALVLSKVSNICPAYWPHPAGCIIQECTWSSKQLLGSWLATFTWLLQCVRD